MIAGVGIDLLPAHRLVDAFLGDEAAFVRKTYTEAERAEANGAGDRHQYLCSRFAAKEAVFKALAANPDRVRLNDIETLTGPFGHPVVTLHGALAELAAKRSITTIHLSITHDDGFTVAVAIAETQEQGPT